MSTMDMDVVEALPSIGINTDKTMRAAAAIHWAMDPVTLKTDIGHIKSDTGDIKRDISSIRTDVKTLADRANKNDTVVAVLTLMMVFQLSMTVTVVYKTFLH